MESEDSQKDGGCWTAWPLQYQHEAIEYFMTHRKRQGRLSISLQFHGTTGRKIQNLVWGHKHCQNLVTDIWEKLREQPETYRDDRAFECIREMLLRRAEAIEADKNPGKPQIVLAEVLEERFSQADDAPPENNTEQQSITKAWRPRPPRIPLDAHDYPVIWTLRKGAFRDAALPLLLLYLNIQRYLQEHRHLLQLASGTTVSLLGNEQTNGADAGIEEEESSLNAEDEEVVTKAEFGHRYPQRVADVPALSVLHAQWAECWARYKKAASRKIPRGRDRGQLFGEALVARRIRYGRRRGRIIRQPGKSRVRWLRKNLFAIDQVKQALANVYVLLHRNAHNDDAITKAEAAEHLWRRDEHYERRPRASHLDRRRSESSRARTLLKALSDDELLAYESELLEMFDHAVQFAEVAEDVEVFLSGSPPSYPTRELALFDKTQQHIAQQLALRLVQKPITSAAARVDEASRQGRSQLSIPQHLARAEKEATTAVLQAETDLADRALFPLSYLQTMRPPKPVPSFALLYRRRVATREELEQKYNYLPEPERKRKITYLISQEYCYEYVLAMVIHHTGYAFQGDRPADFFVPEIQPGEYFYVNFPETPFEPPPAVSLMVFPLECGSDYQDEKLRVYIERERVAQLARYTDQLTDNGASPKPIEECLPKRAGIGAARIITRQQGDKWYNAFVQVAIPVVFDACDEQPQGVLGVTSVDQKYYWALRNMDGQLTATGDLAIPRHVLPAIGRQYSENYPPEVANAIVALAKEKRALIGIEETWTRKASSTSQRQNLRSFAHPERKIADTLIQKALDSGLLRPRIVYGVSPRRCGACGNIVGNEHRWLETKQCLSCGSQRLSTVLPIPLAQQQVTLFANLPGVQRSNLSCSVLLDIFSGKIMWWNDERIARANPDLCIPRCRIALLERPQDSLAAQLLSRYFKSHNNPEYKWQSRPTSPAHHLRETEENDGEIAVRERLGALAYACLTAIPSGLATVAIEAGIQNFELPPAKQPTPIMPIMPRAVRLYNTTSIGTSANYPIAGMLWAIVPQAMREEEKAQALTDLLAWIILEAPDSMHLPEILRGAALASLEQITVQGCQIFHVARLETVSRKRHPKNERQFRPRKRTCQLRVMASKICEPFVQSWLSAYAKKAPKVELVLHYCQRGTDWIQLFDDEIDAIFWHERPREDDIRRARSNDQTAVCLACGGLWEAKERWHICGKEDCRSRQRDGLNRAAVVSRLTLEQLLSAHEKIQAGLVS